MCKFFSSTIFATSVFDTYISHPIDSNFLVKCLPKNPLLPVNNIFFTSILQIGKISIVMFYYHFISLN